ncbi:MAG: HNH endonuclease, partial [Pseudomonas sp.]
NGVKNDNNASNLKVLCIDCHRRQPYHEGMYVKHSDMQVITALRHKVGIFKNNSWGAVLNYADPALLGDLLILKRKGEYPPHIGYSIENNLGETVIFDVAWPQKKTALLIDPIEVPGWKILKRGSYCG